MSTKLNNIAVHASHCCKWHGCKYGDEDCPVVTGKVKQLYLCEDCDEDMDNEEYYRQALKNIAEMKRFKGFKSPFISAIDLAKYVVWYVNSKNVPITNLKLQKLLYYIQGAHLEAFGCVLFHDDLEAWEYGPVVRNVYIQYCGYGVLNLRSTPDDGKLCDGISAESKQLIERVLNEKMHLSARRLIRMAQLEDPWKNHAADAIAHRKPIIGNDEMTLWFNKTTL